MYERDAVLFSQRRGAWQVLFVASAVMLLAGLILLVRAGTLSVWLAGVIGVVGFGWRLLEPKTCVLVSKTSVRLLRGREPEQHYPMAAIARATWSRVDGMVEVFAYDGRVLVRIPPTLLGSHKRSRALAATISRYAGEHGVL